MMGKIFYFQVSVSITAKSREHSELREKVARCSNVEPSSSAPALRYRAEPESIGADRVEITRFLISRLLWAWMCSNLYHPLVAASVCLGVVRLLCSWGRGREHSLLATHTAHLRWTGVWLCGVFREMCSSPWKPRARVNTQGLGLLIDNLLCSSPWKAGKTILTRAEWS